MKKILICAAAAVCATLFSGCSTTPQNFVSSSKPMLQGRYTVVGKEVEGTDTQFMVLGFGASLPGSPQRRALKAALDRAPGADALVEMSVDYQTINLLVLHVMMTHVTGTPVKSNNITR